jgi:hypothetical protein
MGLGAGHDDPFRSPAESLLSLQSIYPTLPRAKLTFLQKGIGLINPLSQFTPLLQLLIGRLPGPFSLKAVKRDGRKEERAAKNERTSNKIPPIDLHYKPSISLQRPRIFFLNHCHCFSLSCALNLLFLRPLKFEKPAIQFKIKSKIPDFERGKARILITGTP